MYTWLFFMLAFNSLTSVSSLKIYILIFILLERESERDTFAIHWFTPQMLNNSQGWARPEPGVRSSPESPTWAGVSEYFGHHLLPPTAPIRRKLCRKHRSRDLSQALWYGRRHPEQGLHHCPKRVPLRTSLFLN